MPGGGWREVAYDAIAVACIGVGAVGAVRIPVPATRRAWLLILAGFAGWVVGDVVFSVEVYVLEVEAYPAPSDVVYLASYAVLAVGLLDLVQGRQSRSDPTALLDAAIVAVGFGIVVGTFVIAPLAEDSSLSVLGRVTASAYPVADVLLVGVLVRLWATVGSRTTAFRLLVVALVATLTADLAWNVVALRDPQAITPAWLDLLWLLGYVAAAVAARDPSASRVLPGRGEADRSASTRRRLVAIGFGLLLPAVTLLVDGLLGNDVPWLLVSVGSLVLSSLILARLALLLRTVEVQAVQLSALARSDGLTGAPNRRTWDHELGRAFQHAEERGGPLSIALLDLDHFKRYNDEHGHQAGDLLLREAVAAWSALLRPGELLARYGGEEFGLILPGSAVEDSAGRLREMQGVTPHGQQFSAGVAAWTPGAVPAVVVERADRALYDAKRAGRARVRIARPDSGPSTPSLHVAFQPIVDLRTGAVVGHEALSRFADDDVGSVFAQARAVGHGPELEAAAMSTALQGRPGDGFLSLNVSLEALVSPAVDAVLPARLDGLVMEVTEHTDVTEWDEVLRVVADWRARGAALAVDDWGSGYSTEARVERLRPEHVKLDRGQLDSLDGEEARAELRRRVDWAHGLGATVCAEGIETTEQWHLALDLGIDLGQGYLFGRPMVTPMDADHVADPVDHGL